MPSCVSAAETHAQCNSETVTLKQRTKLVIHVAAGYERRTLCPYVCLHESSIWPTVLSNTYSFCAFSPQKHHVSKTNTLPQLLKKLVCPRSSQPASSCDDTVRKRIHRHRNEHQTNVNFLEGRKAVRGGSTNTNSENQRVQDLPVVPVCSLDGATFIDLEHAQTQATFSNLHDGAKTERHTHLKEA